MTPEQKQQFDKMVQQTDELYRWMQDRKRQQITLPVDEASKNALGVAVKIGVGSHALTQTVSTGGGTGQQLVGCTIEDSLKSTIVYGVMPKGEADVPKAGEHRRGQYFQVEAVGTDFFDAIREALFANWAEKRSVSVGTPWFNEWGFAPQGILHDFVLRGDEPWHNWKISGWKMISGQPYLIGKTWQGTGYGDGGWCYMSRTLCNKVFAVSGTGAFTVRKATAADIQTIKLDIISTILSYARLWLSNLLTMPTDPSTSPKTTPTAPVPPATVPSTVPESVTPVAADMLSTFCTAIRDYEGVPGDLNYQNNNPGNVRCSPVGYAAEYGNVLCVDTPSGQFAKFPTYDLGWLYLKNLVRERADQHPTWTIVDFFNVYSPTGDNNHPNDYAAFVARRCNAAVDTQLETLLA
jgi:hypothetical protein